MVSGGEVIYNNSFWKGRRRGTHIPSIKEKRRGEGGWILGKKRKGGVLLCTKRGETRG